MEYWSVGVLEYWVVKAEKNYFVTPPRPPRLSEQARDGGQVNPLLQYSIAPIAQLGQSPKFFISLP